MPKSNGPETEKLMISFKITQTMTSDPMVRGHIAIDGLHVAIVKDEHFYRQMALASEDTICITAAEWKQGQLPRIQTGQINALINTIVKTAQQQEHLYQRSKAGRLPTEYEANEANGKLYVKQQRFRPIQRKKRK